MIAMDQGIKSLGKYFFINSLKDKAANLDLLIRNPEIPIKMGI
jgi:hypothetical protein